MSKCRLLINLPNGSSVAVRHNGKSHLTLEIVLNKVLFVLEFKYNLIDTARLVENDCVFKFLSHSSVIEDSYMDKFIVTGKQHNGLYGFSMYKGVHFPCVNLYI